VWLEKSYRKYSAEKTGRRKALILSFSSLNGRRGKNALKAYISLEQFAIEHNLQYYTASWFLKINFDWFTLIY